MEKSNAAICSNVDGPGQHYAKRSEPDKDQSRHAALIWGGAPESKPSQIQKKFEGHTCISICIEFYNCPGMKVT